jgi:hypothetical protein
VFTFEGRGNVWGFEKTEAFPGMLKRLHNGVGTSMRSLEPHDGMNFDGFAWEGLCTPDGSDQALL